MPIEPSVDVFSRIESLLSEWIEREGCSRVHFEYSYIALAGSYICWMHTPEGSTRVHLPSDISLIVRDLRRSQVDPVRGAWLWSHFWMEASDGVLHQECDWMREPVIGSDPVGDGDAAFELDQFPRDPEWIPEWMATKAAAYHQEKEKRERRRQRDRERRAKKKAEAAQAEGTSGSDGPAGE